MNTELVWLWVTVPISAKVRTAEGEREAVEPNVRSCRPEKAQGLESQPRSNRLEKAL